jgi:O-succinylbenzoic acid--CoA ligase
MRDFLSLRADASPDAMALIEAESSKGWTYRALDAAASETAGRLADFGIGPGDHVGVLMSNDVRYVWLVHAAKRLGAVLVPLNAKQTAHELAGRIERADLSTLVCSAETEATAVEAVADADVPVVSVDSAEHGAVDAFEHADSVAFDHYDWSESDPLVLMFTSGTTGSPKGVRLTMGNVLWSAIASAFRIGIDPDDRWLVTLSLYHMGGLAPLYRSTLYGTTVVLRESFEAGNAADDVARYDVTGISLVPVMLRRMLDARGTLADSLRFVLLGGAPASMELLERCRNYSVPVYPTYGMTETSSQVATATPREAFANLGTVGRPLFWTNVTVRDESGEEVPRGETGELVVSGPTVTDGYYGDPEATADAFDDHGFWTGDVGYRDEDGRLWILNRKDDRIITGGENVDPGEVVDVLRSHPDVQDAAVVGVSDPEWGQAVAALVERKTGGVSSSDLVAHAHEQLAGFKVPKFVAFCDELPRTVSGTVERETVRETLSALRERGNGPDDWRAEPGPDDPDGEEASGDRAGSADGAKQTDAAQTDAAQAAPDEPSTDDADVDDDAETRPDDADADAAADASTHIETAGDTADRFEWGSDADAVADGRDGVESGDVETEDSDLEDSDLDGDDAGAEDGDDRAAQ